MPVARLVSSSDDPAALVTELPYGDHVRLGRELFDEALGQSGRHPIHGVGNRLSVNPACGWAGVLISSASSPRPCRP